MTKRVVLTLPMADLRRPRSPCPMTMEKGVFLAKPPEVSPGPSLTGSDSLSPLSSYSAMPPSFQEERKLENKIVTHDPRRSTAVVRQTQTGLDSSGADGLLQPQGTAPRRPVLRPPVLGRGMPLWPAAPLVVPGLRLVPLPDSTITAAPLPDSTVTAAPLLHSTVTAVPLPDPTTEAEGAAPLPIDPISPMEPPLVETHVAGPTPLAILESSKISSVESLRELDVPLEAPVEGPRSPARPRVGR